MPNRRLAMTIAVALFAAGTAFAQQPPLRTGVDGTFAPHAMPKLGGGTEGFQIDLFTEVAKRMKREITIDSVSFSTLIPGMMAGRYDFIAAPTTVTKERAENMLFTAGGDAPPVGNGRKGRQAYLCEGQLVSQRNPAHRLDVEFDDKGIVHLGCVEE